MHLAASQATLTLTRGTQPCASPPEVAALGATRACNRMHQRLQPLHLVASQAALDEASRGLLSSFWQEWAHIETQFVSVAVAIDTTPLTPEQRLYLPLLIETAFKLPCAADGAAAALSKDDFVAALQADTVRYACDTGGIRGGSSQLLTFFVQVELDEGNGLGVALKWIRRALYLTQARARRPVRVHVHVHATCTCTCTCAH